MLKYRVDAVSFTMSEVLSPVFIITQQNGMNESIKSHGETLDNLGTTTSQIKQELKETFDRVKYSQFQKINYNIKFISFSFTSLLRV